MHRTASHQKQIVARLDYKRNVRHCVDFQDVAKLGLDRDVKRQQFAARILSRVFSAKFVEKITERFWPRSGVPSEQVRH
jgi:hypothetical protein